MKEKQELKQLKDLIDLLEKMLARDPISRPSALQSLQFIAFSNVKSIPNQSIQIPIYWEVEDENRVNRVDVTQEMKDKIESMMNDSSIWSKDGNPNDVRLGRDEEHNNIVLGLNNEKGTHHGYEVVKVERIENVGVWKKFVSTKQEIIQRLNNDISRGINVPQMKMECFAGFFTFLFF
jgi:serine/threonine protein kinase